MTADWVPMTLGQFCSITMGQSPAGAAVSRIAEGLPLLNGPTEFGARHPTPVQWASQWTKASEPGDLLFCVRGSTTGRMNWADQKYAIGRGIASLRGASPSDTRFARAVIDLRLAGLLQQATGSTFPNLSRTQLSEVDFLCPPGAERERIAGVLGAFDDLIETNRRLADNLDDLRRTKVSHALAASAATTRLSEVASFVNGRNFTKGADGAGRPVIRTPEVRSGPGGNTVWSSIVADDDRIACAGDILFVWSGTLMVNRWLYTDGLVNQHVFKVIPKNVPDWYVFALIEAQLPWFLGLAKDKATTMGHIQRAHLDETMAGLDPGAIARLGSVIEPIWRAALELRLEAQDLARQRDELLPLLMSGRVRVHDLEAVA